MKRFHVHVAVSNLEQSTRFYSAMFGISPTVQKSDYAKWMLDEPRVNFAISIRTNEEGVNHLGFQAESAEELEEIHMRLQSADMTIATEKGANCCYARSEKYWVQDPSGIAWESFRSLDSIPFYGEQSHRGADGAAVTKQADVKVGDECGTACCPAIEAISAKAAVKTSAKACCNG